MTSLTITVLVNIEGIKGGEEGDCLIFLPLFASSLSVRELSTGYVFDFRLFPLVNRLNRSRASQFPLADDVRRSVDLSIRRSIPWLLTCPSPAGKRRSIDG